MGEAWQVHEAKARFSEFLEASINRGPQIVTRRGVNGSAHAPARTARPSPGANLRIGRCICSTRTSSRSVAAQAPRGVLKWAEEVPAARLFLSAITVGEIQAGIEGMRERDAAKAAELETWLGQVIAGYGILPMDAAAFRDVGAPQASQVRHLDRGCHDRGHSESSPLGSCDEERSRLPDTRGRSVRLLPRQVSGTTRSVPPGRGVFFDTPASR